MTKVKGISEIVEPFFLGCNLVVQFWRLYFEAVAIVGIIHLVVLKLPGCLGGWT